MMPAAKTIKDDLGRKIRCAQILDSSDDLANVLPLGCDDAPKVIERPPEEPTESEQQDSAAQADPTTCRIGQEERSDELQYTQNQEKQGDVLELPSHLVNVTVFLCGEFILSHRFPRTSY